MLVLARRLNERIIIPSIQAAIQVVGIQGGIIRLGIDAPADVKVFREEVIRDGRATDPAGNASAPRGDLRRRLADSARELSALRRELRGKLSASAAATLHQIDKDLDDLVRRVNLSADESKTGEALTAPVAR